MLNRAGELLEHGFTLMETLEFLSRLEKKKSSIYIDMFERLKEGIPLYEVLQEHHFDSHICSQIYFAEKHGNLSLALLESAKHLKRRDNERKKVIKLLQYPLILLSILLTIGFLLHSFLLPRLQTLYHSIHDGHERKFQFVIGLMQNVPWYLLITLCLFLFVMFLVHQTLSKKSAIEKANFYASIPYFQSFYKLYMTIFLSREWSYLIRSGFSFLEIVNMMENQSFSPLLQETAVQIKYALQSGHSFSKALSNLRFIESDMVQIVSHGEQKGKIENELLYYSEVCLQQFERKMESVFIIIQPVMFALIGLMIAFIYLSIYLPMFQMIESI